MLLLGYTYVSMSVLCFSVVSFDNHAVISDLKYTGCLNFSPYGCCRQSVLILFL